VFYRLLTPCLTSFLKCVEQVLSETCGGCR